MRKLFVAVAALGMLLTSCAKDADVVTGGNESMVTINVAQPKMGTRAATGTHDATETYGTGHAAEDLQYAIFEVKGGENVYRFDRDKAGFFEGNTLEGTITERLVNGKTYIAVFWADAAMDKYYTVDWENGTISFVDATKLNAQDENLDAFWGMTEEFTVNGPKTYSATLKRPFAQLNISTCDTSEANEAGLYVETSYIEVSKVYTAFNFWSGEVDANSETAITFANAGIPKTCIYNIEGTAYDLLSFNYLLVNDKKNVDVKFHYASTDQTFESEFTAVPVQRNYRTHIVGDLLTDATNFHIIINPEFDGEHIYDVYDNILDALKNGGSFTLTDNITVAVDERIELSEAAIIDLNGYTLTIEGAEGQAILVRVNEGGSVTFKDSSENGTGAIEANIYLASANKGGVVTVEGGNYTTSGVTLFQANGGQVYIKGGHFEVTNEKYGTTYLLNHADAEKNNGLIEVTGGQFVGFNPADSPSENPRMNFVKEGHASYVLSTDADGVPTYEVIMAADVENITVAALAYQNAKLTWDAVANADHYVVKYGEWTSDKITAAADATTVEYDAMPAEVVKDSRKPVFTVEARTAENGTLAVGQTAGDVEIFTLVDVREPKMVIANNTLTVNDVLDLGGVVIDLKVDFVKDGVVKYSAVHSKQNGVNSYTTNSQITSNRFTSAQYGFFLMDGKTWTWTLADGSTVNSATMPTFEPGTYEVKYTATYFAIINGYWAAKIDGVYTAVDTEAQADRVMFKNQAADVCQTGAVRTDVALGTYSVASVNITSVAPEGYKGVKIAWDAVADATSYEVTVDDQTVNVSETSTVVAIESDTKNFVENIAIKALDSNGAVVAVGNKAEKTQFFTLANRPAPEVRLVDGVLEMATDFEWSDGFGDKSASNSGDYGDYREYGNLHEYGVLLAAEVEFYKDGAATPAYRAKATAADQAAAAYKTYATAYNQKTMKGSNMAVPFKSWAWAEGDGEFGAVTATAPTFEPGTYTMKVNGSYFPVIGGRYQQNSGKPSPDRLGFDDMLITPTDNDITATLKSATLRTDDVAGTIEVGFNAEATATVDAVELSWNPVGTSTYEIYVDDTKVGETAETSYTHNVTAVGDYNFEIKVAGSNISATASAKVEYLFESFWTAPVFTWTGARMKVTNLANIDAVSTCGYAYGGDIDNNTPPAKSTIEIYKDGTLLYTLTNNTTQGNLKMWAAYGRWVLGTQQDNRSDWTWIEKATGNCISQVGNSTEKDVDSKYMPAGTYTIKYTIGYVVCKNASWDKGGTTVDKAQAERIWFGPNDPNGVIASTNVAYTDANKTAVKIMAKTGEYTLVVE